MCIVHINLYIFINIVFFYIHHLFIFNLRMKRLVVSSNFILGEKPIYESLNDIVQMEPLQL
jgi:hypothetical protein